ncbi:hypothetical protein ACOJUR_15590 [Alicyclobacillus tolerans]|uniref:hypothetical protein n=1 Tax=Alicyclobacillus tolerans TaxID=90970 RepID=UPI003B823A36
MSKLAEEIYEEGREEGRMEIVMNMLRRGMKIEDIVDVANLSKQEIESIAKKISH